MLRQNKTKKKMNKNERKVDSKRMQMKETKHRSLRWLHKIRRIVFQIMDLASAMDVILSFFLATLTNSMQTSPAAAPSTRRARMWIAIFS
jgi:hypothetical protein